MTVTTRQYQDSDFDRIGDFLVRHTQPENRDGNWFQPTWEYMHSHPALDETSLDRIRIWEDGGQIVAVANYESTLGEAFFQVKPDYAYLKAEMLAYAEAELYGTTEEGTRALQVYVNDFDAELEDLVREAGFEKQDWGRPISMFRIPRPFPAIELPEGFSLTSLAEENDLRKINRVLWRGFNHEGPPPEDEESLNDRKKMQSGPHFRKDLTIAVVAPDGTFVAFCGMWHETTNHIAYVEPVATDPDYRRMGLGRAAVWEGIRRCGAEGATVAYVGSDQRFYKAIGFETLYTSVCWRKEL